MQEDIILKNDLMTMTISDIKEIVGRYNILKMNNTKAEKKGVLFVSTNGAGLGHTTRMLAVARRFHKLRPQQEIIFLTTSCALHIIEKEGFKAYYVPSRIILPGRFGAGEWNVLIRSELGKVLDFYRPAMFVFDGVVPYGGLVDAISKYPDMVRIWVYRGCDKPGMQDLAKTKGCNFNYIFRPGEAGQSFVSDGKMYYVPPVIFLNKSELLEREKVRKYFGLPSNAFVVYVQLGAGNINNIDENIRVIDSFISKRKNTYAVVGQSVIGSEISLKSDRTRVIKDYPNSRFCNAFDAAITACGYNTFHEMLHFGVPSIFIPNMDTGRDDQTARAMKAVEAKAGFIWDGKDITKLEELVDCIILKRQVMAENAKKLVSDNGAELMSKMLNSFFPFSR